jgi:rare lipoprotein A
MAFDPRTTPRTTRALTLLMVTSLLVLGGCSSTSGVRDRPSRTAKKPRRVEPGGRDGAPAQPPVDLSQVPDAQPRVEPIRTGGPNKPYEVLGRSYVPLTDDEPVRENGLASWYGQRFHGVPTASGEPFDMYAMTAAHPTLPIPSYVRVRNPANGREVIVRVNDRGPFVSGRIIDLSYAAAVRLDVARGVAPVELQRLTHDEIRRGDWRTEVRAPATFPAPAPAPVVVATAPPPTPLPPPAAAPDAEATPPAPPPSPAGASVTAPISPVTVVTAPARGWWLQLGAFQEAQGASSFHGRLLALADWLAPVLTLVGERDWHKLQVGPYASREEAGRVALRLREELQIVPMLVERR